MSDESAHLTLQTADGNIYVLPVSLVRDWISGEQQITSTDDWEVIVRRICEEWLQHLIRSGGPVEMAIGEPSAN